MHTQQVHKYTHTINKSDFHHLHTNTISSIRLPSFTHTWTHTHRETETMFYAQSTVKGHIR